MELSFWVKASIFAVSFIIVFIVGFKFGAKWRELEILEYV